MAHVCPSEEHCSEWAKMYMSYCLCSVRDGVSLTVGLISVCSWCIAEIPQIITNYKAKSADGLSITFLTTWLIGDLFNLVGCMLEPATLPTQYYMALLYTLTTLMLASQAIYYGHIYPRVKCRKSQRGPEHSQTEAAEKVKQSNCDVDVDVNVNVNGDRLTTGAESVDSGNTLSSPIPFPMRHQDGSSVRESYYMSARSLTSSHTPTAGTLSAQRMTPPAFLNWGSFQEPLLCGSPQSAPPPTIRTMLCLVSVITFISTFNLHDSANRELGMVFKKGSRGRVMQVTRKLLQVNVAEQSNGIGTYLGWAMAAIYMGGRLPQICLNMRRGSAEGLNPLMFVFALIGNATYVASILVNSLEWSKIAPNLPWLVDAGGCVLLDSFILIQFAYFRHRSHKDAEDKHEKLDVA